MSQWDIRAFESEETQEVRDDTAEQESILVRRLEDLRKQLELFDDERFAFFPAYVEAWLQRTKSQMVALTDDDPVALALKHERLRSEYMVLGHFLALPARTRNEYDAISAELQALRPEQPATLS